MLEDLIADIQRYYPQIYLACHVDHVRNRTTRWRLSSRDSSILSHLDPSRPMSPRDLASHLGVAASTLSATLARLERLGYITNTPVAGDHRKRELRLTLKGADAMSDTSVLDSKKLRALLERLSDSDQRKAVKGLAILAGAARS